MPTYSYKCNDNKCNHSFEIKQSIKEESLKDCPICNNKTLEKQITNGNFILTGIGVYKNNTH